jgi:S-adenosyl-L-methionine hydrolase (adenosine-forming)
MKRSGIITLLTDFGISDPYVAMMKGVILSVNPDAVLVDIGHLTGAGEIAQAAGVILEAFSFFPEGTVHLVVVDPGVGSRRRSLVLEAGGHFFVGPDNGLFSPVMARYEDARLFHLTEKKYFLPEISNTFHGRDIFAPVSAHLSHGESPENMGLQVYDPIDLELPVPQKVGDTLFGEVINVDNFGNLVTNISRRDLDSFLGSASPVIYIGNQVIEGINKFYGDISKNSVLAIINSSEMLEIAVNMGKASELMGVEPEQIMGIWVKVVREKSGKEV